MTCQGNGTHFITNNAGALRMRCSTCNTHHAPAPKVALQKVTPPAPGPLVATIKAGLAKQEVAVLNEKTGAERHYMVPTAPAIPERATTPAERMGKTPLERLHEKAMAERLVQNPK